MFCLLGMVVGLFVGDMVYLFFYFINDSWDGFYLVYSLDGLIWIFLNYGKFFLIFMVGKDCLMCDFSIC